MKISAKIPTKFLYVILVLVVALGVFYARPFLHLAPNVGITTNNKTKIGTNTETKTVSSNQATTTYNDFHLLIPDLNISAPIISDVDGNDSRAYSLALQKGVAQHKNTSKPGENGNIFIFGHSSYYFWDPGKYKEIFKPLDKVKVGSEIDIWWQQKEYKYKVSETKIVSPTDLSVLDQTKNEQLTLMTCFPTGTTKERLIVIAKPY